MDTPLNSPQKSVPQASIPSSVPTISGPSMLGLNVPAAGRSDTTEPITTRPVVEARANRLSSSQYSASQSGVTTAQTVEQFDAPRFGDLSGSSFREQSFSGLDSYIETEQPRSGAGRLILLLVLLAALGAAGWWTYNNYRSIAQTRKSQSDAASAVEAPADSQSNPPAPASPPASTPPPTAKQSTPPSDVAEGPSENAGAAPDSSKPDSAPSASAPVQRPAPVEKTPAPAPVAKKAAPRREPTVAAAAVVRAPKPTEAQPVDTGESSFRRAEAYLYGRGAAQNCDEAVKNLKDASAKSNAKARSTFGTMYATGHCVPRDLPTSYLWFALALRVDPNNQILEKDLTAVWNQMTPPERQMASRMKQ
jgi:hypothetical protein